MFQGNLLKTWQWIEETINTQTKIVRTFFSNLNVSLSPQLGFFLKMSIFLSISLFECLYLSWKCVHCAHFQLIYRHQPTSSNHLDRHRAKLPWKIQFSDFWRGCDYILGSMSEAHKTTKIPYTDIVYICKDTYSEYMLSQSDLPL
jgi:hypothetical protein